MRRIVTILILTAAAAASCFAADAKAGQAAYDRSCKSCHGADGTPNAAVAKMMKVDYYSNSFEPRALVKANGGRARRE